MKYKQHYVKEGEGVLAPPCPGDIHYDNSKKQILKQAFYVTAGCRTGSCNDDGRGSGRGSFCGDANNFGNGSGRDLRELESGMWR